MQRRDLASHDATVPSDPLARRLAAGDVTAMADAYQLHRSAVRGFARRLVRDGAAAEDLVHDVFLTLPAAARRFRHDSTLRAFLGSVAVNHARHHFRSARRQRTALLRLGVEVAPQGPPTPEENVARKRLATALSHAIARLPVDQRAAFVLCTVEGRSSSEAAQMVGVPEATVRTRLFHAKKKLREMLSTDARHETEGYRISPISPNLTSPTSSCPSGAG